MNNMSRLAGAMMLAVHLSGTAHAAATAMEDFMPDAGEVGSGRYTFIFWDVYDAALFAPGGTWTPDGVFALQLRYLRNVSGEDIAAASVREIRRQGFDDDERLARWHAAMLDIFPDVRHGSTITGIHTASGEVVFIHDGGEIGRITDNGFARRFFGIWLGENTRAPGLRAKLLGRIK